VIERLLQGHHDARGDRRAAGDRDRVDGRDGGDQLGVIALDDGGYGDVAHADADAGQQRPSEQRDIVRDDPHQQSHDEYSHAGHQQPLAASPYERRDETEGTEEDQRQRRERPGGGAGEVQVVPDLGEQWPYRHDGRSQVDRDKDDQDDRPDPADDRAIDQIEASAELLCEQSG
jgi:hypothetical protein